ncbi:hypothetical protein SAMN05660816_04884 [Niastella yeongjuensis]|nr:hypothetical protein SAMN05660816_04884 [Niastella yeongjuensis]
MNHLYTKLDKRAFLGNGRVVSIDRRVKNKGLPYREALYNNYQRTGLFFIAFVLLK